MVLGLTHSHFGHFGHVGHFGHFGQLYWLIGSCFASVGFAALACAAYFQIAAVLAVYSAVSNCCLLLNIIGKYNMFKSIRKTTSTQHNIKS